MLDIHKQQTVNEIIEDELGVPGDEITPKKELIADLGSTSIHAIEIVMRLESEFGITIPDEAVEKIVTVQDIYNYIETH